MTWFSKNKYQSFKDWLFGRWKCPNCGIVWDGGMAFDDMTLKVIDFYGVVQERVECPECGFSEVLMDRKL